MEIGSFQLKLDIFNSKPTEIFPTETSPTPNFPTSDPLKFQFYLPESKYLFRFVELERRFFGSGKTVVRLMAYQNFAIEVGNLPD